MCLATIQGLGRLAETAGQTVVNESDAEDPFEGVEDGLFALDFGGVLDFVGSDGGGGLFSVRLCHCSFVAFYIRISEISRRLFGFGEERAIRYAERIRTI